MINDNEIGRRIAMQRKERGYTQEQISLILNATPQAVSKWEKGNALPDTSLLPLLAKTLGVSIDRLLTGGNLMEKTSPYDGDTGTDIDKILPPVSRFSRGSNRTEKKQGVIEKLLAFFEKFYGVVGCD